MIPSSLFPLSFFFPRYTVHLTILLFVGFCFTTSNRRAHPFAYHRVVFLVDWFFFRFIHCFSLGRQSKKFIQSNFYCFRNFFFILHSGRSPLVLVKCSNIRFSFIRRYLSDLCISREMNTLILSRQFLWVFFFIKLFFFSFWFGVSPVSRHCFCSIASNTQ